MMTSANVIMNELAQLPQQTLDDVYLFITQLKEKKSSPTIAEISLLSEKSLARDWLLPIEDEVWKSL